MFSYLFLPTQFQIERKKERKNKLREEGSDLKTHWLQSQEQQSISNLAQISPDATELNANVVADK